MMRFSLHIGLVGLAAGLCSALLSVSIFTGSVLSLLLFFLCPLPILIVALGWSHWASLVAVVVATIALALAIDPRIAIGFPLSIGLPAWCLGYLALLGRPAGPDGELEWYPVGRLVLWAGILSALVALIGFAPLGSTPEAIQQELRAFFEQMFRLQLAVPAGAPLVIPGVDDPKRFIDLIVRALPTSTAVLTTIMQLFNLWLAGRVVKISGRLRRPWPDIAATRLPPAAMAVLVMAFAASLVPGIVGWAAKLPTATLLFAYAAMGFAVMHGITRFMQGRAVVLIILYLGFVLLSLSGWPMLLMALLGMIDGAFDLRRRIAAARGPPPIPRA